MSSSAIAAAVLVALLASGCGSAFASRARTAAPGALQAHAADALTLGTADLVDVPPTAAWNGVVEAVRERVPLAEASFGDRRLTTHWAYEPPAMERGVAIQRRARHRVVLTGSDARSYRPTLSSDAQERRRETCAEPSDWTPTTTPSNQELTASSEAAIARLAEIPLTELAFPGSTEDVLSVVSDLAIRRWGLAPSPGGLAFPLRSGWRETESSESGMRLTVRSSVVVSARAAVARQDEPDSPPGPVVHLDVQGLLQWRGEEGDQGTAWMPEPATGVVEDFYARLAERLPPLRVALRAPVPIEPHDPEPSVPELPNPPDPLVGRYELAIPVVIAPIRDPNGREWDESARVLGVLVEWAPTLYRIARVAFGDPSSLLELAVQVFRATQRDGIEDAVAARLGEYIGQWAAPDLSLALRLPGVEGLSLQGPDNSHVAGWTQPVQMVLSGPAEIGWVLVDRDPAGSVEEIARGSVSAAQLANACDRVCVHAAGAQLCFALRRMR